MYPSLITLSSLLLAAGSLCFPAISHARDSFATSAVSCEKSFGFAGDVAAPTRFHNTNNLRRETGEVTFAKGREIIITGRVVNTDCVPLKSARVTLWHADAQGRHAHLEQEESDKAFLGSGETYTNNLGEYYFLTVMPGKTGNLDYPIVYLSAHHGEAEPLDTAMLFPGFATTLPAEIKRKLTAEHKGQRNGSDMFVYNIVLDDEKIPVGF